MLSLPIMADPYDEEIRRLAEVLSTAVRLANRTRQSVEGQIGFSSGYLSKVLGGTVDLRVRHILAVAGALGLEPGAFFRLAFPAGPTAGEPSPEALRLVENTRAALGQAPPAAPAASADFDEQVKSALIRLLGLEAGRSSKQG